MHKSLAQTVYLPKADVGVAMFSLRDPAAAASAFLLGSRGGRGEEAGQPRHGGGVYGRCCLQLKSSAEP